MLLNESDINYIVKKNKILQYAKRNVLNQSFEPFQDFKGKESVDQFFKDVPINDGLKFKTRYVTLIFETRTENLNPEKVKI